MHVLKSNPKLIVENEMLEIETSTYCKKQGKKPILITESKDHELNVNHYTSETLDSLTNFIRCGNQ